MGAKRLIVILLLVFAAGMFMFGIAEAVSSEVSDNVKSVSAEVLAKAYDSNRFKAQKTYSGKTLEVSGKIFRITSEENQPMIVFNDGDYNVWVHCYVANDDPLLMDIEKGGNATIRGYVSDVEPTYSSRAYTLTDCKIISAH